MSFPGPFGGNPFEGMPIFGDLARMFQNQGPVNWDVARQIGTYMAAEGEPEGNVDPVVRIRFEELSRVAEMHVSSRTGLDTTVGGRSLTVVPASRSAWASATLEAYKPLFETLATSLSQSPMAGPDLGSDLPDELKGQIPEEFLGNIMQVMAPTILGMQLGLMAGHLARRSLGQYDLPVPRPASAELFVVAANLDEFASDWSLPPDDVRLWVCIDNIAHASVLGRTHVATRVLELLEAYAGGFRPDATALSEQLEGIDPTNASSWEQAFGDPRALLGSMETDEQRRIKPQLEAVTVVIEGFVDYVLDSIGATLISSYGPLTEALRRRRVEANQGDKFVEQMFGLELSQKQYDRGEAFVRGIVERAGEEALTRLWSDARHLPTPSEVDAPGLWWERVNLPAE